MDTINIRIQIPTQEIAFLTFIMESYEGIATVRTIDPEEGIVELMVSLYQTRELHEILKDLMNTFPICDIGGVRRTDLL